MATRSHRAARLHFGEGGGWACPLGRGPRCRGGRLLKPGGTSCSRSLPPFSVSAICCWTFGMFLTGGKAASEHRK
eukprot:5491468-Pyramimonas_sp.AAC.1